MKHNLMPSDLALWAALPMAHTSRIEGRLTMILDSTRRRGMPRRALVLGVAVTAAALVPLAMLRPTAQAQAAPAASSAGPEHPVVTLPNGVAVRLAGVADTQSRAAWWSAGGTPVAESLPRNTLVFPALSARSQGRVFAVTETYALAAQPRSAWEAAPRQFSWDYRQVQPGVYARLPHYTWEFTPDDHRRGLDHFQPEHPRGRTQITQTNLVPLALDSRTRLCQVCYAVAAGPWTQSAGCLKKPGKTAIQTPSGPVIFTLFPNPHHLAPAQAARGSAVFMVTDRFGSFGVRDPLSGKWSGAENYDRAVYALDSAGRVIAELGGSQHPGVDEAGHFKYEQLMSLPNSLLSRVASFQIKLRPYQWAEFNNVALQPAPSASSAGQAPASIVTSVPPQNYQTPWTSQVRVSRWRPHTTLHARPSSIC